MALTQSFDVEFNDSVLDLQGWKNPRHHGSKLIAKKINQLSPPEFSKGFSTSSLVYLGKNLMILVQIKCNLYTRVHLYFQLLLIIMIQHMYFL